MLKKSVLGKGIGALLQNTTENQAEELSGVLYLPLDKVLPNPHQPRKEFAEDRLKELADSIRQQGIIQPIIVEKNGDGKFMIIAGERRYRAAKLAQLNQVPVIEKKLNDEEKLEIALIENIQREDLTPIEEAWAFQTLMEKMGLNQNQIAEKVGKNRSTVANSLRLLRLPADMQEALTKTEISAGHARAILAVVNPADQRILFSRIKREGLSVREAEAQSEELNRGIRTLPGKKNRTLKKKDPLLQDLEQKFIDVLGTKVSISGKANRGKIEITFFSADDLDRIYQIMVPKNSLF